MAPPCGGMSMESMEMDMSEITESFKRDASEMSAGSMALETTEVGVMSCLICLCDRISSVVQCMALGAVHAAFRCLSLQCVLCLFVDLIILRQNDVAVWRCSCVV